MIDNTKVEAMIKAEVVLLESMLGLTQQFLDMSAGQTGPALDKMRVTQERTLARVRALPAAVMDRAPFKDAGALHTALTEEVLFVVAALDGGGH
jgi:hypothetical protein